MAKREKPEANILCKLIHNFCTFSIRPLDPSSLSFGEAARPTLLPASKPLTSPADRPRLTPRAQTPFWRGTAAWRAVQSHCRKSEEQKPISLRFSHCAAVCAGTSVLEKELTARRWAAGERPSVHNQFHVNLPELQVRRVHLQGAPLPSIHTGAASTDSWKQSRDAEEKISSVCLEMSPGYPEDLVGGSALHLYLMFTKHPFLSSVRDRPCLSLSAQLHD